MKSTKIKYFIYFLILLGVLLNIILFYDTLLISAGESFEMIYKTVICIIFPYMIIAEIISKVPVYKFVPDIVKKAYERLFSADITTISAFIMGNVCGYPVGAKILSSQFESGLITKKNLERMLPYVTNSSMGFAVGTIGIVICQNKFIGIIIYLVQILSTLMCAFFSKKQKNYRCNVCPTASKKSIGKIFADSTINTVLISGTIISFNLFITMFANLLTLFNTGYKVQSIIKLICASLCEITNGVMHASNLLSGYILIITLAMINSFSGLSVAMQIKMLSDDESMSLKPYFLSKILQTVVSGALMALLCILI